MSSPLLSSPYLSSSNLQSLQSSRSILPPKEPSAANLVSPKFPTLPLVPFFGGGSSTPTSPALSRNLSAAQIQSQSSAPSPLLRFLPASLRNSSNMIKDKDASKTINDFGFRTMRTIQQKLMRYHENSLISPCGLDLCLMVAANGSTDETFQEIMRTLGHTNGDLQAINSSLRSYRSLLCANEPDFNTSSSLWTTESTQVKQQFSALMADLFNADCTLKSNDDPDAWLAEKQNAVKLNVISSSNSKSKSKSNLSLSSNSTPNSNSNSNNNNNSISSSNFKLSDSSLPEFSTAMLVNVTNFKCKSRRMFEQHGDDTFDNGRVKCKYMRSQGDFYYYEDANGMQAVTISLVGNTRAIVILPPEPQTASTFIGTLDAAQWSRITGSMHHKDGTLILPRFKVECNLAMKSILSAMGMQRVFSREAQFVNATSSATWLDDVIHKTFVDFDEAGPETGSSASTPKKMFNMHVTRPFILAICDALNTTLFIGVINTPSVV